MSDQVLYATKPLRRMIHPRDYLRLLFIGVVAMLTIGMGFAIETRTEAVMAGMALLCGLLMMMPMLSKRHYCAFEPATVVLAVVLFSVTAKVWMIFALDNSSAHVQGKLLLGHDTSVLHKGLLVMAVGIFCYSVGYLLSLPRLRIDWLFLADRDEWHNGRLLLGGLAIAGSAAVFFALFVQSIGFSWGDSLSAKRFIEEDTGSSGRLFKLSYYYYRLAAFSKFAFYLMFVDLIAKKRKWLSLQGCLVALTGFQSIMVPIFLNNRAGVALLVIDAIVILYFVRPKLVAPTFVVGGVMMFSLFFVLLMARKGENEHIFGPATILEETLGGRDLMDITKTSHIVNAVPHELEYRYGETLWGWIAAPIPRSLWEGKPMWATRGPYLMHKVYGDLSGYTGIPPGLVAELYWNLGWYGVTIGMLVVGIFCQFLFKAFFAIRDRPCAVLIYTIIINRLVLFSFGNDLGTGIVKAGLDVVPLMFLIILIAKKRRPPARPYGSATPAIASQ